MKDRVIAAISGGVDSSTAAYILKKKGFQCIGITIKTWPKEECAETEGKTCCSLEAINIAKSVACRIGIPHYVLDLSRQFKEKVRDYFAEEYKKGKTPNPCIYCNSEIKFGLLFAKADELGAKYIATGHFARIAYSKKYKAHVLKKGRDKDKDQSYFLFNIETKKLPRILFPLGGMTKEKVRALAKEAGLKSHNRPSSQDVCFKLPEFASKPGKIIFTNGKTLGAHKGIEHYTLGQRRGLGIGYSQPLYVTKIDPADNIVYVGIKKDTYKKKIVVEKAAFHVRINLPSVITAKIRYGQKCAKAVIEKYKDGGILLTFLSAQIAPTPGQAAVFYDGDIVIGGGWIKEVLE